MAQSTTLNPAGLVTITLGWIVLDRPDQSGVYIAKDLSAGWAYLIADEDGDNRHRGQGACAGGVDVALRCAVLAAIACVPECIQIHLIVDTRMTHRVMVSLALHDTRVAGAIGRRRVSVITRPLERAAQLVQAAAERAASDKLRERERSEWHDVPVNAETTTEIPAPARPATLPVLAESFGWRQRQGALQATQTVPAARTRALRTAQPGGMSLAEATVRPGAMPAGLKRLFGPLVARRPKMAPKTVLPDWLHELDSQIDSVHSDLEDVGA